MYLHREGTRKEIVAKKKTLQQQEDSFSVLLCFIFTEFNSTFPADFGCSWSDCGCADDSQKKY